MQYLIEEYDFFENIPRLKNWINTHKTHLTLEQIYFIVSRAPVTVKNLTNTHVTILHCGFSIETPFGLLSKQAWQYVRTVVDASADKSIRHFRMNEDVFIGALLEDSDFKQTVADIMHKDRADDPAVIDQFYAGNLFSFWGITSKRFVDATEGDVVLVIGNTFDPNAVFTQIELPALRKNANVTSVSGLAKNRFDAIYDSMIEKNGAKGLVKVTEYFQKIYQKACPVFDRNKSPMIYMANMSRRPSRS